MTAPGALTCILEVQVCMLTCCPQLLRNFVYDDATLLGMLRNPFLIVKRMIARDLIIAEAFCRNFWWHTLMLWPCELPSVTVMSLSYDDKLVPCELVQKQLQEDLRSQSEAQATERVLEVMVQGGLHGTFLLKPGLQQRMLDAFHAGINKVYSH
jgi:hypothetical protein